MSLANPQTLKTTHVGVKELHMVVFCFVSDVTGGKLVIPKPVLMESWSS